MASVGKQSKSQETVLDDENTGVNQHQTQSASETSDSKTGGSGSIEGSSAARTAGPTVQSATTAVLGGWNTFMSSLTKNFEAISDGLEDSDLPRELQPEFLESEFTGVIPNASPQDEPSADASLMKTKDGGRTDEFLSGVIKSVTESIDNMDARKVQENMDIVGKSAASALSTALQSMNVDESALEKGAQSLLANAKTLANQVPEVVFTQGEEETLAWEGEDVAPWNDLPEAEAEHSMALENEMMKIVADSIYSETRRTELFFSGLAKKNEFKFEYAKDGKHARGSLNADPNLRELRTELVPSALSEGAFWDEYFFHVDRLRRQLCDGVEIQVVEQPSSADVKGATSTSEPPASQKRNWDEEIDKIFDD
ncbi:hypothetical protein NDN08_003965 [Rhodosorus marinus]|uniref:BSD domain-containing protein n=1 Tax=Rhodosorus marinus TaxID=101924 RepID=A0AAV8UGZ1_9RHOD|nr:hypothetical protein NDN08_003965 [Rhodosorus marinus]